MIKKLLEGSRQFYIPQKESYAFADVQAIIEQYKGKVLSFDDKINGALAEKENSIKTLTSEKEELASSLTEAGEKATGFEKTIEDYKGKLAPFEKQAKTKNAIDLLKGKVADKAEAAVYDRLNLEDIKFTDDMDAGARFALVEKQVNAIVEESPYLAAAKVEAKGDDKQVFVKKAGENEEASVNIPQGKGWGFNG